MQSQSYMISKNISSTSKIQKVDISSNNDAPWMQHSMSFPMNNSEEDLNQDTKQNKITTSSSTNTPPTLVDMRVEKNTEGKPPYSYATLIKYAIERSPGNKLTLSQIYQWVIDHYPYYGSAGSGWKVKKKEKKKEGGRKWEGGVGVCV